MDRFSKTDTIDRTKYRNNINQYELNCKRIVDSIPLVHSKILQVHKVLFLK